MKRRAVNDWFSAPAVLSPLPVVEDPVLSLIKSCSEKAVWRLSHKGKRYYLCDACAFPVDRESGLPVGKWVNLPHAIGNRECGECSNE